MVKEKVILICVLSLYFASAVYAKIHSSSSSSHGSTLMTITNDQLQKFTGHSRSRRSTGTDGSDPQPIVETQTLNDPMHHEAIVHWSGIDSDVIFILTRQHNSYNGSVNDSRLWRSDNYGSSYKNITTDVTKGKGVISYYVISPSDKNTLLFVDQINRMIYRTVDEGKTFTGTKHNFSPDKVLFHPTRPSWVLAYDMRKRNLHFTSDLFASTTLFQSNVNPRYFWGERGTEKDSIVHMEVKDPQTGHYLYKRIDANKTDQVLTDLDVGNIDVDSLLVQNEYIFVQKTTHFSSYLYVSHKRESFRKAYFPGTRHAQDFSIVNADEHQVFIAANHHEGIVSLYLSDTTGQFYTTSLDAVVMLRRMEGGFDADLYEVKSMNGTYIANQLSDNNPKTLITFDQGGQWHPLHAPDSDPNSTPDKCKANIKCGLHLHLHFSAEMYQIPFIVSDRNAPGFILAHGVVGTELVPNNVSLYMSTDGGWSWKKVFDDPGFYYVKILDHGAAMISMPMKNGMLAQEIQYSSSEGETWQTYSMQTSPQFKVEGVINEPGINTLVVSIFGHDNKTTGWTIVKLNFTSVLNKVCGKDDFENWKPADKIAGVGCLLGQKMSYERKKSSSKCHIERAYDRPTISNNCTCAEEDYECDYGYEEDPQTPTKCNKASWFDDSEPLTPCPYNSKYKKSMGYRKVAADKCVDGSGKHSRYSPVETKCPLMAPRDVFLTTNGDRTVYSTGENISFTFYQERGTKKITKYKWNFGDSNDSGNLTIRGYESGHVQTHTYTERGVYTIKVVAQNTEGSASSSITLMVEDHIEDVSVLTPHGAQVNREVLFEAVTGVMSKQSRVHYIWTFGDEGLGERPILTWNESVYHTFKNPGNYTVTLEAVNNVGSIFRNIDVIVYGTLTNIQMDFDQRADRINTQTQLWRDIFGKALKKSILNALAKDGSNSVDPARLEVVVLPGQPTLADVAVLPAQQMMTNDPRIKKIANRILNFAKAHSLVIELGKEDFGLSQNITVIGAKLVADKAPRPPSSGSRYTAVYVAVPLIMIAILITVLIVMYYRKKFERLNRYSLLEARSGEPDSLLDDTDDDDPPLDPNPDPREERLAFSDDDMDDPLSAHLGRSGAIHC